MNPVARLEPQDQAVHESGTTRNGIARRVEVPDSIAHKFGVRVIHQCELTSEFVMSPPAVSNVSVQRNLDHENHCTSDQAAHAASLELPHQQRDPKLAHPGGGGLGGEWSRSLRHGTSMGRRVNSVNNMGPAC